MDAHDLLARHREHAERVVGAQVVLVGEREFPQIVQAAQVVGMHAGSRERGPVMGDPVVGEPSRRPQARELQGGNLVATGGFDRLARRPVA